MNNIKTRHQHNYNMKYTFFVFIFLIFVVTNNVICLTIEGNVQLNGGPYSVDSVNVDLSKGDTLLITTNPDSSGLYYFTDPSIVDSTSYDITAYIDGIVDYTDSTKTIITDTSTTTIDTISLNYIALKGMINKNNFGIPDWQPVTNAALTMYMYARVEINGEEFEGTENNMLGAFAEDPWTGEFTCRGVAIFYSSPPYSYQTWYFEQIKGYIDGEEIFFKIYDNESDFVYVCNESVIFEHLNVIGTCSDPFNLTAPIAIKIKNLTLNDSIWTYPCSNYYIEDIDSTISGSLIDLFVADTISFYDTLSLEGVYIPDNYTKILDINLYKDPPDIGYIEGTVSLTEQLMMREPPDWQPVTNAALTMYMYARVEINGEEFTKTGNNMLGAFAVDPWSGELTCRGVAIFYSSPPYSYQTWYFEQIKGYIDGEEIFFKIYDEDSDLVYDCNESVILEHLNVIGTCSDPFLLTVNPGQWIYVKVYDNSRTIVDSLRILPDSIYHFDIEPGTYDVEASAENYVPQIMENINVYAGQTSYAYFNLEQYGSISGTVILDSTGTGIVDSVSISITQNDTIVAQTSPDSIGIYNIIEIENGIYDVTASLSGYVDSIRTGVVVPAGDTVTVNFYLEVFEPQLPVHNITQDSSYSTIQAAIDNAAAGDTILVDIGTYEENINYNGKNITIASLYLTTQDTSYISQTIIDGDQNGSSVVRFINGEDSTAVLSGFTITNGSGGGIYCMESSPSLENVTITGNSAIAGGGIYCMESSPSFKNVTITGNSAIAGGGIYCRDNSSPSLINSILWNDSPQEIYIFSGSVLATYSDIQGGWTGEGNIDSDPLFVDPDIGNYHLQSNSPCIDAGDPSSPLDPDGTRADMGAYYYHHQGAIPPTADFTADTTNGYIPLTVNFTDLSTQGSGVIDEWYWEFGDGNNSSLQNPANEYQLPGNYTVSLTVTDVNDSTDTKTKIDYITVFSNDPPAQPTNVQINISGYDAIITWAEVDTTIYGNPINVDAYLVYFSEIPNQDSLYFFLGLTPDTTYTHQYVVQFSDNMFYQVVAYVGDLDLLQDVIAKHPDFKLGELDLLIEEKRLRMNKSFRYLKRN